MSHPYIYRKLITSTGVYPHPFWEHAIGSARSPAAGWALVAWVTLQTTVLASQDAFGSRWFIPARFLPQKYNYRRVLPNAVKEMAAEYARESACEEGAGEFGLGAGAGADLESDGARSIDVNLELPGKTDRTARIGAELEEVAAVEYDMTNVDDVGVAGMDDGAGMTRQRNHHYGICAEYEDSENRTRDAQYHLARAAAHEAERIRDRSPMARAFALARDSFHRHVLSRFGVVYRGDRFDYEMVEVSAEQKNTSAAAAVPSTLELDCVICLMPVQVTGPEADYFITPCDHVFHPSCLERWMEQKMVCPTCRQPLAQP